MSEYHLELKQIVDYPRCRIYRQFIRSLMADRNIRVGGSSGLFYFTVLCSYANFRTSYKRVDGISYTIYPGEWICKMGEISDWFRTRFQYQALEILQELQERHLIAYTLLGRGKLVKFKILSWRKYNRILDYNAPCQKETGFFFLPVSIANELLGMERCSEIDIVLDFWFNTIYNDEQVQGSNLGPVVYMRNGTGNPLVGYQELSHRWGISKSTVSRYLKKLSDLGYISIMSYPGTYGSVIYLKSYLSTMFEISDVMIDKNEVAMVLNIKIDLPEEMMDSSEVSVSKAKNSVSDLFVELILQKVGEILAAQGFSCFSCPRIEYKLLPLFDCRGNIFKRRKENELKFLLLIFCKNSHEVFRFEITWHLREGKK